MKLYINKPIPCPICTETQVVVSQNSDNLSWVCACPTCNHDAATFHGESVQEVLYDRAEASLPRDSTGYNLEELKKS